VPIVKAWYSAGGPWLAAGAPPFEFLFPTSLAVYAGGCIAGAIQSRIGNAAADEVEVCDGAYGIIVRPVATLGVGEMHRDKRGVDPQADA